MAFSNPGDTIYLDPGTFSGRKNRDIYIEHHLTMIGAGAGATILDAGSSGRHFEVSARFHLKGVSCVNGKVGPVELSNGMSPVRGCLAQRVQWPGLKPAGDLSKYAAQVRPHIEQHLVLSQRS